MNPLKDAINLHLKRLLPKTAGEKPISFHEGGLHESTGTPAGVKIPAAKKAKALSGGFGPKAAAQARFAKNVLKG